MKKRCFALLLALSLLLTGCSPLFDLYSAFRGEYTRPDYSDGAISYREFQRPYQPRVKYTAEPDIEYVRPDVDGLCSTLKSIGASATGGKAAAADIINQFDAAYDDYVLFNTMGELAYLRYTRDLSDSYYEAEYTWSTDQTTRVEKAMEDCYTTMAKSSLRSALEEQYFGEDFFASYDSDGVYSDARTVALLQQESELQAQYVALQNDPAIEWNGAVRSVSELLENAVTADLYYEVLGAYYDAYGAQAGEIYIKLIQTRRELAGRLDYAFFARDADNVDYADAVVLFGMEEQRRGLNGGCQYCHFKSCADCAKQDGLCAWDAVDVGIAIGSAVSAAADARVDSRVMFSVGRAAKSLGLLGEKATLVLGLPLSVSGKSPFFDRKPKK